MKTNFAGLLALLAVVSGCSGASTTDGGVDAGPSFDGGPGTLWVLLWDDSLVGLDTRDGRELHRFEAVGSASGGDGLLAFGSNAVWFEGATAPRGVDVTTGVASSVPGVTTGGLPTAGAGAVWWAKEGTQADPNPIYRFDPVTQATTHTNGGGLPNGTAGLIAAGADGCWSLYSVLSNQGRGVAHVKPDGSAVTNLALPGALGSMLGTSVATGGGRGYALLNTGTSTTKRLYAIDAATDAITTQRDLSTPEFGSNDLLANEDHLLFAEGTVWYVDAYGEKFHELDPATLATRRSVTTGGQTAKQTAIGGGGAWSAQGRDLRRTDLVTGTVVTLTLRANARGLVFQAP